MRLKDENGQAMVEFALVLPILLLLVFGIINFGWIFGSQLMADNAVREAARYTAVHYNDSASDDDRVAAAGIVANRAPMLRLPTVTLNKSGENITVRATGRVPVLTPMLSAILGNEYTVQAQCVMRVE